MPVEEKFKVNSKAVNIQGKYDIPKFIQNFT